MTKDMICQLNLFVSVDVVSVDPVSKALWGETSESGQLLYNLRGYWAGNDGITYNLQYAAIINQRTRLIKAIQIGLQNFFVNHCQQVMPDPSTDRQTFAILNFDTFLEKSPCH